MRTLRSLEDAMGAMKSLSAHHLRAAREALAPAREYAEGVDRVLRSSGAELLAGAGPAAMLVLGGDWGLCGSYHAQLVAFAGVRRRELGPGPTWCVGRRLRALLARAGLAIERDYPAPASLEGIGESLLVLAQDFVTAYVRAGLSRFEVVASRFEGVGRARPRASALLPIARRPGPAATLRYGSADRLRSAALREHLYVALHQQLLEALACEHAERLLATQSAQHWLDERAERVRRQWISTKREATTQEVLEIAAGGRARGRSARSGD